MLVVLVIVSVIQGGQLTSLDQELQEFLEQQSPTIFREAQQAALTHEELEFNKVYTDVANTIFQVKGYTSFCQEGETCTCPVGNKVMYSAPVKIDSQE